MRGISTGWNTSKPYCSGITPLLSFPSLSLPPSLPFLSFISNIYRAGLQLPQGQANVRHSHRDAIPRVLSLAKDRWAAAPWWTPACVSYTHSAHSAWQAGAAGWLLQALAGGAEGYGGLRCPGCPGIAGVFPTAQPVAAGAESAEW